MELISGFLAIGQLETLLLILFGVVIGIIFGAIPGLSAVTCLALALPVTFGMSPVNGISLLLGIYVGAVSGGLVSAIMLGIPGTPSSIATCFDGHPMAKRGEAGKAIGVGIVFSFIGGIFGAVVLVNFGPEIAKVALKFSPYEYFSVILFALTTVSSLSSGNLTKGLISCLLGVSFSLVGIDELSSYSRFTMGFGQFDAGINLVPLMIGVFAVTQIFEVAEAPKTKLSLDKIDNVQVKGMGFSVKELISQWKNAAYSALIGLWIGILPGIGGNVANLMAYAFVKKRSKYPEKFGTGIIDGIVASETSNNATIGGALTTLLTLGIPGDNATALILAGFMIHSITPGPLLFTTSSDLVYALFAAFILANFLMLICEFFMLRYMVKILSIPQNILLPLVIVFCFIGAYSSNNRIFDVGIMVVFGIIGYVLTKYKFPHAPMIVGFILAPMLEVNLRRSLMRADGSLMPLLTSPISLAFLFMTLVIIVITIRGEMKGTTKALAN